MAQNYQGVVCFLCNQLLKTNKDYRLHLENGHSITSWLEDILKFSPNEFEKENENAENTDDNLKSEDKSVETRLEEAVFDEQDKFKLKSVRVDLKDIHMTEEVGDQTEKNVLWYNKVEYKCLICDKNFWGNHLIHNHCRMTHKISGGSTRDYYSLLSKDDTYSCKICNSVLKRTYSNIRTHLKRVHRLKVSQYEVVHEAEKVLQKEKLAEHQQGGKIVGKRSEVNNMRN